MGKKKTNKKIYKIIFLIVVFAIIAIAVKINPEIGKYINDLYIGNNTQTQDVSSYNLGDIPEYTDKAYVVINNNKPNFNEEDYKTESFEQYSELDILGRCGVAYANISSDIMPSENEERESITSVTPTGWKQKEYKSIVDGNYLYNRCHLIGWQLSGENDNEKNLITGTRYMNVEGMLPFENSVADYLEENPNNHVLYRITPVFEGNNLLASRSANGSIFSRG